MRKIFASIMIQTIKVLLQLYKKLLTIDNSKILKNSSDIFKNVWDSNRKFLLKFEFVLSVNMK